jgi:uncharacterized protein YdaU (DUF1376 family)
MRWFPWHPVEHRRATYKLSLSEDGAYRRLIDEYMINREPLPDDDAALARISGVGLDEWLAISPNVRVFFKAQNGRLVHKRCDSELQAQDLRMQRFSERGKKAAAARYNKDKDLDASCMHVHATGQDITGHNKTNKKEEGLGEERSGASLNGMVFVLSGTPPWEAWKKHLGRFPREQDHRVNGRLQRGSWFPSEWPHEPTADPN